MTDPTAPEPTMEEILASIRQIISEDLASAGTDEPGPADGSHEDDEEDVLILTERAPPEPSPFAPSAEAAPASAPAPEPPPGPDADAPGRQLALSPAVEGAVVAPETAQNVAASFERLSYVVESKPQTPPFAVATGGATLEDITRELLKPVLKAWLDENLADIVRARVDEEVERITRGRVR